MNRRGFIGALAAFASGAVLDPEELLWIPGAKMISIGKPRIKYPTTGAVNFKVCNTLWQQSEIVRHKLAPIWKYSEFNPAYAAETVKTSEFRLPLHFRTNSLAQGARLRDAAGKGLFPTGVFSHG